MVRGVPKMKKIPTMKKVSQLRRGTISSTKKAVVKKVTPIIVVAKEAKKEPRTTEHKTKRLLHLEHVEDHLFLSGKQGYDYAVRFLSAVHTALVEGKNTASITEKLDGSPSIVFGYHPNNKKFFISTKSFFNKNPVINYSHADLIDRYSYAPLLLAKMKVAFDNLSKITPETGIYQGDLLHVMGINVEETVDGMSFLSNTITYSATGDFSKRIYDSAMSIAVHVEYTGTDVLSLTANYKIDRSRFISHQDVLFIDTRSNLTKAFAVSEHFQQFLQSAKEIEASFSHEDYDSLSKYSKKIITYINACIKKEKSPTALDLSNTVPNTELLDRFFMLHSYLQRAKDQLNDALSFTRMFRTHINGKPTKGEGFVALLDGIPSKIVDRMEFSRENFLRHSNESFTKSTVVAFGRMNPPTKGHEKLIGIVKKESEKHNANYLIAISSSHDSEDNPLAPLFKLQQLQKLFPNTDMSLLKEDESFIRCVSNLFSTGTDHLIVVAGSDRLGQYEENLFRYNGRDEFFNFKKIEFVSSGQREADDISASKMRAFAALHDYSSFNAGLPSTAKEEQAQQIYEEVQKALL